jgi:hypothetical protein
MLKTAYNKAINPTPNASELDRYAIPEKFFRNLNVFGHCVFGGLLPGRYAVDNYDPDRKGVMRMGNSRLNHLGIATETRNNRGEV